MDGKWHLLRCNCGRSFGAMMGQRGKCPSCGSMSNEIKKKFNDPNDLADAVSLSNLPPEIASEIEKRESRNKKMRHESTGPDSSRIRLAMQSATDENGIISLKSLSKELHSIGAIGESVDYIIGQAEMEGMLVRIDDNSWSWLQQSS